VLLSLLWSMRLCIGRRVCVCTTSAKAGMVARLVQRSSREASTSPAHQGSDLCVQQDTAAAFDHTVRRRKVGNWIQSHNSRKQASQERLGILHECASNQAQG
jgi:hypothetical protein